METEFRPPSFPLPLEDILEIAADPFQDIRFAVAGDFPTLGRIERSKLVDSMDMVRMRMGIENGIDPGDPVGKRLLSKVRGGIDKDILSADLNED
jgi:hypothetical protein